MNLSQDVLLLIGQLIMIAAVVCFTFFSLLSLIFRDNKNLKVCYYLQVFFSMLFHIAGWLITMNLQTSRAIAFVTFVGELVFFICYLKIYRKIYEDINLPLQANMIMLQMIGLLMLNRLSVRIGLRQFAVLFVSAIITLVIPSLTKKLKTLCAVSIALGIIGLGALVLVLLKGMTTGGAKMFLKFPFFNIQPSEFVKITYVLFIAYLFHHKQNLARTCLTLGITLVHIAILFFCKDLGSAVLFLMTYIVLLYVATRQTHYLVTGVSASAVLGWIVFILLNISSMFPSSIANGLQAINAKLNHVGTRIQAWMNPWSDITGSGYQTAQALFAIGSGGYQGSGLFQGRPDAIPVSTSDYIFAAICEEMGVVIGICIILICLSCFFNFTKAAMDMPFLFYRFTSIGLAAMYFFQCFVGIGGCIKMIPETGVTLPLVAFGANSILSTMILFQIEQGIYRMGRIEEEDGEYDME